MVIDASVAFKLIFNEPDTPLAIALAGSTELTAPGLLLSELGNALWKRVRRNELDVGSDPGQRLVDIQRIVRIVDEAEVMPRAFEIAIQLGHPIYDCVYLALAEILDDHLVTGDNRFLTAIAATPYRQRVRGLTEWPKS